MTRGLIVLLGLSFAATAEAAQPRRFAILVGNNTGSGETVELRYAESDVQKVAAVLRDLGGFRPEDVTVLLNRSAQELTQALDRVEAQIQAQGAVGEAKEPATLLFYYSGHAKQGQLLLGQSRVPMAYLRERLQRSAADVKIGILDACESGAITREKGGRRGPSFLFDLGDQEAAKGLILIGSSSEDEASQESDELGGSFFTHYLTSGLRGDADESGDHRITLGEVYAYTYHRTVNSTAGTRSGTQHPTYSFDLKGQGDVVMTDVSTGRAGVSFGALLDGDYLIFDMDHEQVAAEIQKRPGLERRVALPPGSYVLKKRLPEHLKMVRFTLGPATNYQVDDGVMEKVDFEDDYAKGASVMARIARERPRPGLRGALYFQGFFSGAARAQLLPPLVLFGVGVDAGPVLGATLGLDLLLGGTSDRTLALQGLNIPYDFFELQLAAKLLWGWTFGPVRLEAGPRVSGLYALRSFPKDDQLQKLKQDFFGISPAAEGAFTWFPGDDQDFSVGLGGRVGLLSFGVDENRLLFFGELGLSLGYRL